ncbi:hypothetical protein EYB26_008315 [Talaromyces marneffei]|uniref:uncharacterized protein n=1 Tax=Talaromyces marneffei TaxID=37727 RepID=UPI0012A86D94|nr:uncharacterized protein EYB26_008315 [Talaromyces marneffei]QGA20609.1 hypothetical protein EYB26_008315 [Talaromyces marneffei]
MLRPRLVLRFVLYLAISWLVLAALYIGLPSFSRDDDGTEYATNVLKSGGKLTRVYEVREYFSKDVSNFINNNEPREFIALTFRIDKASNALVICGTTKHGLTRAPETVGINDEGNTSRGSLSVPAGDVDGVSLPWFETADAVMMFHFIHRDKAVVTLDVGYREGGRILKVWPAGSWQDDDKLLFSLTLNDAPEGGSSRVLTASVPLFPLSLSPSPTYQIRLVLLIFLAPLTILFMGAFMGASFVISTVLGLLLRSSGVIAFLLLVRWVYKGRPSFNEFVEEIAGDLRGLAKRVQTWRNRESSSESKDEEQPSLRDEDSPTLDRKDVS